MKVFLFFVANIFCLLILSNDLNAQLVINEFLASNYDTNLDVDFNENSDWIEIYNSGNSNISLEGYYITDNLSIPDKWQIKGAHSISAGGYLIIWADGFSSGLHTSFKLSAGGEQIGLFSPTLELIDSISFSAQQVDISYGRVNDVAGEWGYFLEPSPNVSNDVISYTDFVYHKPIFSKFGGIYYTSFFLQISNQREGLVRYTLDGSEPTELSALFDSPIEITSTSVVRARIFMNGLVPGPIVTHSYFLNTDNSVGQLPIISITSNPANFWNQSMGIYVQDFKPEWEVPINIELFENDGSDRAAFNEQAGTKVNGLYSWKLPQKMLGIYFRKKYGSSSLDYSLFKDDKRKSYENFALRASGSDWSYTLFRDVLGHDLAKDFLGLDIQKYRPCVVYVNGAYLGIHNIREKVESNYIEENHQLAKGSFDLVENEVLAEAGDSQAYAYLLQLLGKDLSVQSNFDAVAEVMDVENFTDYFITQAYVNNTSITHNVMCWKPKDKGKWRWVVMDLDRGFFNADERLIPVFVDYEVLPMKELLTNDDYKNYFIQRFSNHLYAKFCAENVVTEINELQAEIQGDMSKHIQRWLGTTSSYGDAMPSYQYWEEQVSLLRSFAHERPIALMQSLTTDYGAGESAHLSLATYPPEGGGIVFNDMILSGNQWNGVYPKGLAVDLRAQEKAGFTFKGWSAVESDVLIAKQSNWKYLDSGITPDAAWTSESFNDATWKQGAAELGYGDSDENTKVNGNIFTCYFRKEFTLTEPLSTIKNAVIDLLKDDGAIVYINGVEVLRVNMPQGEIDYGTAALSTISKSAESSFTSFDVNTSMLHAGQNIVAVEVHQVKTSSSDLSFDLSLQLGRFNPDIIMSTVQDYSTVHSGNFGLIAVFESTSQCVVPESIKTNLTLYKACSPYILTGETTIATGATLSIEPGVELWLSKDASIIVHGNIQANGVPDDRIVFKINPDDAGSYWKNISFIHTDVESNLSHLTIENASHGNNRITQNAAISCFYGALVMDDIELENISGNPIHARYSSVSLKNSMLHSEVTGDFINVKYGEGVIENCVFIGNDQPDTDAIDFDDVADGIIRNCKIYNMLGSNSDAIDIGEKANNVLIENLWVYNVTDKGISVGQGSSASIRNSVFINCNTGLGLKDSCQVKIDRCSFYNNGVPVNCFEKNKGDAGGNAVVTNAILSNAYISSTYVDSQSSLNISYSLSDNDSLPLGKQNIYGDPRFMNPNLHNLALQQYSAASMSGKSNGELVDMGASLSNSDLPAEIIISHLFIGVVDSTLEFIGLYNPANTNIDLAGYKLTKGVSFLFPEESVLKAKDTLFITKNARHAYWNGIYKDIYQWDTGKLSNNGERVQLEDSHGIVVDYIRYLNDGSWPLDLFVNQMISLKSDLVDNHFGANWMAQSTDILLENYSLRTIHSHVYPNPAFDRIIIESDYAKAHEVYIYSVLGRLLDIKPLDNSGKTLVSTEKYHEQLLILKIGTATHKVFLLK